MVQNIVNLPTYEQVEQVRINSGYHVDNLGDRYSAVMGHTFGEISSFPVGSGSGHFLIDDNFMYTISGAKIIKYDLVNSEIVGVGSEDFFSSKQPKQNSTYVFYMNGNILCRFNKMTYKVDTYPVVDGGGVTTFEVDEEYIYFVTYTASQYYYFKYSVSTGLEELRTLTTHGVYSMVLDGEFVYSYGQGTKLRKHRKSNLSLVSESASFGTSNHQTPGMWLHDGIFYIINNSSVIFRVNSSNLLKLTNLNTPGIVYGLTFLGSNMYMSTFGKIIIMDIVKEIILTESEPLPNLEPKSLVGYGGYVKLGVNRYILDVGDVYTIKNYIKEV